jgi:hypothetical protein
LRGQTALLGNWSPAILDIVVEQLGVVNEEAFELALQFLSVDPLPALHPAIEPRCGGLDADAPCPAVGS